MTWIVVNKTDAKPVAEIFSKRIADKINREKYQVVPVLDYLSDLNRKIKNEVAR